ncbi:helix-turn-helix domain-containing protein [Nocardiopsis lambiniae]|uniref:Helix-turn-helix transcriptional regulator n=1 Tax=Nocardiopsis lambiniae TaxID=3075539 RepID=A0ABU2M6H4_9ACTN|nr:helix-turn-helix transcriptional regulator [Nocardiopsis sp. DSM 44743]MDT0328225.1 helix-turn-helix transcriptional regulator [Nocardiopsis sp. DSM 44743]
MPDKVFKEWDGWGRELRRLREEANLSQLQLAHRLPFQNGLISGFERATRKPKREHAVALDGALSTGDVLERLWLEVTNTREIPADWRDFVRLERQAVEIREYQMVLMPGLLQTREYAHAVLRNHRKWDSDRNVTELAKTRSERLSQIRKETLLWFVIDEVMVRRVVGSREVLKEQLDHLLHLLNNHRIRVTLIPEYAPQHPGLSGSFRIMNLSDGRIVGLAEYWGGQNVVTGAQVNQLLSIFSGLQAEALSPIASYEYIKKTREALA